LWKGGKRSGCGVVRKRPDKLKKGLIKSQPREKGKLGCTSKKEGVAGWIKGKDLKTIFREHSNRGTRDHLKRYNAYVNFIKHETKDGTFNGDFLRQLEKKRKKTKGHKV